MKLKRFFHRRKKSQESFGLGNIVIPEEALKHDWMLTEKYQAFSAELLRLAGLGIAAVAFLYEKALKGSPDLRAKELAGYGVYAFAVAIVFALLHRYYSSDTMSCHIRYLRLQHRLKYPELGSLPGAEKKAIEREAEEERTLWHDRLASCGLWLVFSAIAFAAGGVFVAVSFAKCLFI
jgi:hypothetical protein